MTCSTSASSFRYPYAESIDWLAPASCLTQRLGIWLESLLRLLPISHLSQLTGLHLHTLKTLDRRRLEAEVGDIKPGEVRRLVMDEFAHTKAIATPR